MLRNLYHFLRDVVAPWLDPDRVVCRFPRLTGEDDDQPPDPWPDVPRTVAAPPPTTTDEPPF